MIFEDNRFVLHFVGPFLKQIIKDAFFVVEEEVADFTISLKSTSGGYYERRQSLLLFVDQKSAYT